MQGRMAWERRERIKTVPASPRHKGTDMDTFVTKAARLNGPRDIELIERELVCGEDDIIVKNHLMGICGSDKNFYRAACSTMPSTWCGWHPAFSLPEIPSAP